MHRAATPVDDVEVEGNAKIGAADDFVDHRGATATVPKGDQICYAFQKGLCSRGNECGFRHEMPPETDLSIRLVEEIAKDDNTVQQSDEEGEDFVILRCQICRFVFPSAPLFQNSNT